MCIIWVAAAVHTHGSLTAQTRALQQAWDITPGDRLLHALPLHHIHGAVAALLTTHSAGAAVEMLPRFSPAAVWESLMVTVNSSTHPCKCSVDSIIQAFW